MWEELVGFDCIIYKPQRAEERKGGEREKALTTQEWNSPLCTNLIFRSWSLPFQSGPGNTDGRKCLYVERD